MAHFGAKNTYKFSSKHGIDTFLGYLRGTSGWGLYESSDRLHGRLAPELGGVKYDMDWKLSNSGSIYTLEIDGTQLNGRAQGAADQVWEKLDALHLRSK